MTKARSSHFARRVSAVAWREFVSMVFTKAFIFGVLIVPGIMIVTFAVIPALLHEGPRAVTGRVLIFDPSGTVAPAAQEALESILARKLDFAGDLSDAEQSGVRGAAGLIAATGASADTVSVRFESTDESESDLKDLLRVGDCLAYAIVPEGLLAAPPDEAATYTLAVATWTSPSHTSLFTRSIRDGIVKARLDAAGEDHDALRALLASPEELAIRVSEDGNVAPESAAGRMLIPMGFMMLMWMVVFTGANQLLTSTIEEKSNKVMEVLLSAASPFELLTGKVLGQGLVSLLMLGIYGSLGVAGLVFAAMADLVTPMSLLLLVCYGVTAYFMVAAMMAAVGSAVNDLKEAQSLVGPVMLVVMVPLILWLPISENPNGWVAVVTSFIPPLTPFVMILRATGTAEPIPFWQIPATIALSVVASVGFLWVASRIFRVGVLMQGKTPTPMELLRWAMVR